MNVSLDVNDYSPDFISKLRINKAWDLEEYWLAEVDAIALF